MQLLNWAKKKKKIELRNKISSRRISNIIEIYEYTHVID